MEKYSLDILNHYDINAVEETWSKCSLYNIKEYLENKKVVLCAVDSSALWKKQNGRLADHCILIAGIYSYKNKIEKITIFDTGIGEVHNYNVEEFINAYKVIDGCCIVLN